MYNVQAHGKMVIKDGVEEEVYSQCATPALASWKIAGSPQTVG
jgi:hypothetical protein